ncbi:gamma carbonic anhydrase family protein, partial [Mesorhizobium sp. M0960]
MPIYAIDGKAPTFEDADSNWIAPDATLIGNIRIGRNAGFWFGGGAPPGRHPRRRRGRPNPPVRSKKDPPPPVYGNQGPTV